MTEKALISVIIPVYKVEDYLRECVDSVLNQTYPDLEVILVDDGSPDGCPQICDAYAEQDERVQVIHQKNVGLSGARNAGLTIAKGDYILFLDSDDFMDVEFCARTVAAAEETGADIVVGEIVTVDEKGNVIHRGDELYFNEGQQVLDHAAAMREVITEEHMRGFAWGKLYRKEITDEIIFPVGKFYEDRYTVPKYFHRAKTVCQCPGAKTFYRMRANSITHDANAVRIFDLLEGEEWLLDFCEAEYPQLSGLIEQKYFGRLVHTWIYLYDSGDQALVDRLLQKMRSVYQIYGKKDSIHRSHKISFKCIFAMPKLYRKMLHMTKLDKNEREQ